MPKIIQIIINYILTTNYLHANLEEQKMTEWEVL